MTLTSQYFYKSEGTIILSGLFHVSTVFEAVFNVLSWPAPKRTRPLAMSRKVKPIGKEKKTRDAPNNKKTASPPEDGDDKERALAPTDRKPETTSHQPQTSQWSGPKAGKEDMELIRRFLSGDQESFTGLVVKYQNKVYNLCFRVMGEHAEAQDMAQEIFLTVHKSLKNFRGDSLFSTWIFRVTVNHCKNRIKYLGRRKYYSSVSIDKPLETEDGDFYQVVTDEEPDPESQLESRQIQDVVQAAIATLDSDHRMVIVLRDIQEMSYEEIAEIVGVKVGTVKSRIHRARSELKKKLVHKLKQ